jgi:hypothetical protein
VALDHVDHSTPAHRRSLRFCIGDVVTDAVSLMMRQAGSGMSAAGLCRVDQSSMRRSS